MTTATQLVSPDRYYNMVCQRLVDFDNFYKAKCAECESTCSDQRHNWLDDKKCHSQCTTPYLEQYRRLIELEVWLAHCINQDLKVQISASDLTLLVMGAVEVKELQWCKGNGYV